MNASVALGIANSATKMATHAFGKDGFLTSVRELLVKAPRFYSQICSDSFVKSVRNLVSPEKPANDALKRLTTTVIGGGLINGALSMWSILNFLDDKRAIYNRSISESFQTINPQSFIDLYQISSTGAALTAMPLFSGALELVGETLKATGPNTSTAFSGSILSKLGKLSKFIYGLAFGLSGSIGSALDFTIGGLSSVLSGKKIKSSFGGILGKHYLFLQLIFAYRYFTKYKEIDLPSGKPGIGQWGLGGRKLGYNNNPNEFGKSGNYGMAYNWRESFESSKYAQLNGQMPGYQLGLNIERGFRRLGGF
jgi:hypothetical protein